MPRLPAASRTENYGIAETGPGAFSNSPESTIPGNQVIKVKRVICTIEHPNFQAPSAFGAGM
jgi:hypothetical protein